jgi:hypothetical protein
VRSVFAIMGLVSVAVLIPNRRITEHTLTDAERDACHLAAANEASTRTS